MTPSSLASSAPHSLALTRLRPLQPSDRAELHRILVATGAFSEDEIAVALELVDAGLQRPGGEYRFLVAEHAGQVLGYACHGAAPMTDGVHDLYWIAVAPEAHGRGIGRALMDAVEQAVRGSGGRMLLIETASKPSYEDTRGFYERAGYSELARIRDYYCVGDDKVIYGKRLARVQA